MALSIGLWEGGRIILGLNGLKGSCDQVGLSLDAPCLFAMCKPDPYHEPAPIVLQPLTHTLESIDAPHQINQAFRCHLLQRAHHRR